LSALILVEADPPQGVAPALEITKLLTGIGRPRLAYQPVVSLTDGSVVGYEALARFGAGHRSPTPYFQAADALDRRADVESLLLQHALENLGGLPADCFLALNVTPRLLVGGPVWSTLTSAGDLSRIVLEVTEHERVANLPRLRRRIDTLRAAGARLALDDVGAGWSGLQQVVELRPDIVKLDRSLVQRLHLDPARRAVTELLATFTDRVGGTLLAEGVETLDELDVLLQLDVELAQGYLLGRPQFGWGAVPHEAQDALADRVRAHHRTGALAVPAPVVRTPAGVGFLDGEPRAVLIAPAGREVTALWVRNLHGNHRTGRLRPPLLVQADAPVGVALALAMQRPEPDCYDPLVCVDETGSLVGLVHLRDLVVAVG
jgi:EAL domain-containing protein (putative c-di-GMP-specific phosphodiesterase class I)